MERLLAAGFQYPRHEHDLNDGMVYFHESREHRIGSVFSDLDARAAMNGQWSGTRASV